MAKRIFDIIVSAITMLILLPFLPLLALLLKLTGEGEIFFVQQRMGYDGKPFGMIKFATMLKDSPNLPGGDFTLANDPRVLPVGRFLRKTRINELPQLWNILKGDMSFVGPRPLVPASFDLYPEAAREAIKALRPGLTGIGSIIFQDEEQITASASKSDLDCYYEDILPHKGNLEIWYRDNQNLWLDCKLVLFTAIILLFPNSKLLPRFFRGLPVWPKT
jgi:lipopolysaccharide/colanic/teichoic acid biosynthesis glycosyltransferase